MARRPRKTVSPVLPDRSSNPGKRTLTLSQIYAITPERYKERAESARIRRLKRRIHRETGRQVILAESYTRRDHTGALKTNFDTHYQMIESLEDDGRKTLWTSRCKVSCSCADFMFVDEVALFKRANADIYFSNGENPVIKNPKLVPQCCKHLVHIIHLVRRRRW